MVRTEAYIRTGVRHSLVRCKLYEVQQIFHLKTRKKHYTEVSKMEASYC
jgi:hypothetical protein